VACVSHFSDFHFHRIFTAIVGETVNDYISRRRLEQAIHMLVFKPDMSITDVAIEQGFSSSANFSKAIKIYFGFSPSEIRSPEKVKKIKNSKIGKIFSKYGKDFNPTNLYPIRINKELQSNNYLGDKSIKVEIKELKSHHLCSLTSLRGYEPEAIFSTWDKINDWALVNGIEVCNQQRFGLCYDNPMITPIDKCRYQYAVVIDENIEIHPPFTSAFIPQGKYASLYLKGKPNEVLNSQLAIYSEWLPSSGFEPDDFPLLEHYFNDLRIDGIVEMEVLVKLKILS